MVAREVCLSVSFERACYGHRVPRLTASSPSPWPRGPTPPGCPRAVTERSRGGSAGPLLPHAGRSPRDTSAQGLWPGWDFLRTALRFEVFLLSPCLPLSFHRRQTYLQFEGFFRVPNSCPLVLYRHGPHKPSCVSNPTLAPASQGAQIDICVTSFPHAFF